MRSHAVKDKDDGSATVLTVGVIAGIVILLSLMLTAGAALVEYVRAVSALENATLTAAEAAVGDREGYPCTLVAERATQASAASRSCLVRGHHVRVTWQISVLGLSTELRAQAGAD